MLWRREPRPKPKEEHRSVTQVLDRTVPNMEHEFIPAAEAMPEEKYGFAPTNGEFKGVRTFAQQIKHVAAVNFVLGAALMGQNLRSTLATSPARLPSDRGGDLKFLKESFDYVHKAIVTINEKNLVEP